MLQSVGRVQDAVDQLQRANDMLALYVYTPYALADALVAIGRPNEARKYFNAAIDLAPDPAFAARIARSEATGTQDLGRLADPKLPMEPNLRAALLKGYRAAASGNVDAKSQAVRALLALPEDQQLAPVAVLLGQLGANHEAFEVASRLAADEYPGPAIFWYPSMHGVLNDPGFPAVANQLRLMTYWKTSHTKPDVCSQKAPPPFCAMI